MANQRTAASRSPDDTFRMLFGQSSDAMFIDLYGECKLDDGFESQEIGKKQASVASAGTLAYVGGMLPGVPDAKLAEPYTLIASWIQDDGQIIARRAAGSDEETTWAEALCLVALSTRPSLVPDTSRARLLAERLANHQKNDGAWSFRSPTDQSHPLFCVYPILGLTAAARRGWIPRSKISRVMGLASKFALANLGHDRPTIALLAGMCYQRAQAALKPGKGAAASRLVRRRLKDHLIDRGRLTLAAETVEEPRQPLWYAKIHLGLLYMCARPFWPPTHPIPALLANELCTSYNAQLRGWKGKPEAQNRYSWTTALGLLAGHLFARDLHRLETPLEDWRKRAKRLSQPRRRYKYDVALSFAGEQRDVARVIKRTLERKGVVVFYDDEHEHELLGDDVAVALQRVYFRQCRFAVPILSRDFLKSDWAGNWEWRNILARIVQRRSAYVLPYYWEPKSQVRVKGLVPTIGYIERTKRTPVEFANIVAKKVLFNGRQRSPP